MSQYAEEKKLGSEPQHTVTTGSVDTATMADLHFEEAESRRVARKIDLFLLPVLCITYMTQYLDKTSMASAALWGIRADTHLIGSQYASLTTLFYAGYMAFEYPVNVTFQRFDIGRSLSVLLILWGLAQLSLALGKDFAGLAASRFFLGAFECGVSPALVLLTSVFWTRSEQPWRTGLWFSMNGFAQLIGGGVTYAVGSINDSSVPRFRYPFIIYGSFTVAWGIVCWFILPSNPSKAPWLTEREKAVAIARVARNQTGYTNKTIKWYQIKEAVLDVKIWLLFFFTVASNIPNGGITTFGSLVVQGFGLSTLKATLYNLPFGACEIVGLWITGAIATLIPNTRIILMLGGVLVSIAGCLPLVILDDSNLIGRLLGYYLTVAFTTSYVLSLGLLASNVAGRTKRSFTAAFLFVGYSAGNLIGPQLFFANEAPGYKSGFISVLVCFGAQFIFVAAYGYLCLRENRKRNAEAGLSGKGELSEEEIAEIGLQDLTDQENKYFRYML